MKYQIILQSAKNMTDEDFHELIVRLLKSSSSTTVKKFKLVGARSLEGIQAKAWEPAERYRDPLE